MAQKILVSLIDDIDGSEADETVSFAFDGVSYEIDLSSHNAELFRRVLAPYILRARRTVSQRRSVTRSEPGRELSSEIRKWAKRHGHKVSERGRIPASITRQYTLYGGSPPGPDFDDYAGPGPDFGDGD